MTDCEKLAAIEVDVLYALRQLKKYRCQERAVDALERIVEVLGLVERSERTREASKVARLANWDGE